MATTIPTVSDRNRNADLTTLAVKVVKDRLSFNDERLNSHTAESPDLMVLYVSSALNATYRVDWMEATDEEAAQAKAWADYCDELFSSVESHVVAALTTTLV